MSPDDRLKSRFLAHAPPGIRAMVEKFGAHGHACHVVGGCVRDLLMDREIQDWDLATDARPEQVAALFDRTTLLHARHGTTQVRIADQTYEVTTYRVDGPYSDGRHPDYVRFSGHLEEDLARRDFTVNAMAYDPESHQLIDPFGGRADIERRMLRTVGDPKQRFREDALRLLRAARFAAVLDFAVEAKTRAAMAAMANGIDRIAAERIREEILKTLSAPRPSVALEILRESGVLERIMPELSAGHGVPQNEFHAYDIYAHGLVSCDHAPREKPLVRLAALLHDVGKVPCREEHDGRVTFYGHERTGARMVETRLRHLRFPNRELQHVTHLVEHHMFHYESQWGDAAVRRFIARVGTENLSDLFDLRIADSRAKGPEGEFPEDLEAFRRRIEDELAKDRAFTIRDLAVTGRDLMAALHLEEGPLVGSVLRRLLDFVLEEGGVNDRERLLARAATLVEDEREGSDGSHETGVMRREP